MEKIRQRYGHLTLREIWIIAACISAALCGFLLRHADFSFKDKINVSYFDTSAQKVTSTDYRYETGFQSTLLQYENLEELFLEERSFALPGLTNTNVLGKMSDQMVPQGICMAGDYILISAYNYESRFLNGLFRKEIMNSVIYILSKDGEYLTTMVLPDVSHVGGLAYDGHYVWVAKGIDKMCSAISYQEIEGAAQSHSDSYLLPEYNAEIMCGRTASFVEYYNGLLWIGTFCDDATGESEVGTYELFEWEGQIYAYQTESIRLPSDSQGISFYKNEDGDYMTVSSSYGRYNDSVIYLYQMQEGEEGIQIEYSGECTMPPMSEEMYNDGQNSYIVFESAATCYSTNKYYHCIYPVDRVCVVNNADLLACMQ